MWLQKRSLSHQAWLSTIATLYYSEYPETMTVPTTNGSQADDNDNNNIIEGQAYANFLLNGDLAGSGNSERERLKEELKMTPLFSWSSKVAARAKSHGDFTQYALLGHVLPMSFDESTEGSSNELTSGFHGRLIDPAKAVPTDGHENGSNDESIAIDPVMLNTDTPWSAFICGSQGSGKSHTMFAMSYPCNTLLLACSS
jgi:hypothetical protein